MVELISGPTAVSDHRAILGEGPLWDPRDERLYWLDIKGGKLFAYSPKRDVTELFEAPGMISALGLAEQGGFICARRDGFARLRLIKGAVELEPIADPEADLPGNRFNDGKVDPAGGFWAGTMENAETEPLGRWWRLTPSGDVSRLAEGYMVTNGPAFDPARGRVFLTDSARQSVFMAETDGKSLGVPRPFLQFKEGDGYPDGMTIDAEGYLWIAFWDGWAVRRFSPAGDWVDEIRIPVARPTSIAFGGGHMFVTSASVGLSDAELEAQPLAGALFEVELRNTDLCDTTPCYFGDRSPLA
tara:strand:+ start:2433 stop:3332 length:900 start_codon:yes stop_codon:yes gene_type:complete